MTKDWSAPLGSLVFLALAIYYGGIRGDWLAGGAFLLLALLMLAASAMRARSQARSRSRGPQSGSGTERQPAGPPGRR